METLLALLTTFGVNEDSRAAFLCLELGDMSGSSTETFLLTGNLGDWKIGVGAADEKSDLIPAGVVDLIKKKLNDERAQID